MNGAPVRRENPFAASIARRAAAEGGSASAAASANRPASAGIGSIAGRRPDGVAAEEVAGYVESIKLFNDWGVATVWTEERKSISVTGTVVKDLKEGLDYTFSGRTTSHPKYGSRFEAQVAAPLIRPNPRAMIKFIAASFDGIGERSAAKLVESTSKEGGPQALEALRQQLLTEPWSIDFESVGRTGVYSSDQKEATIAAFVHRNLATRLSGVEGMRDTVIKALAGYLASAVSKKIDAASRRADATRDGEGQGNVQGNVRPHGRAAPAATQGAGQGATSNSVTAFDPVEASWAMLSRNPYAPIASVPGYSFIAADTIGRMVNMPPDAPQRLAALVAHALREHCERNGHVYLTREQLDVSIVKLDHRVDTDQAIAQAVVDKTVIVDGGNPSDDEVGEGDRQDELFDGISGFNPAEPHFYRPSLMRAEVELARRVARMLAPSEAIVRGALLDATSKSAERMRSSIRQAAQSIFPTGLDPSQEEALRRIASAPVRLHTLTAGPGCGKTALMEVLVRMMPDKRFHFCAPTGKAAKVLSNRLASRGYTASTIHSLLKGAGPGSFEFNAAHPLTGDVLVVDESSMPDVATAEAVFAAVGDDMHVILLGDPRQLPSIQPGRVLMDLLQVAEIDHNQLTVVHRNSGGILDVVNEIGEGRLQPTNRESVTFSGRLGEASDEFHSVMGVYLHAVAHRRIENVMLMMPRRQGKPDEPGWNATYANAMLRAVCNPNAPRVTGSSFHVNDRIVIRENMTLEQPTPEELDPDFGKASRGGAHGGSSSRLAAAFSDTERKSIRVVNGDTGTIKSFTMDPKDKKNNTAKWVAIDLDDGRRIQFPGEAMAVLGLAYAMTVHGAQGSEYQEVIMVVTPGQPAFMNRNMLFTGASRARQQLRLFGDDRVLVRVAQTPLPERNSALIDRIRFELDVDTEPEAHQGVERPSSRRAPE